jgi:hypothetical protein
MITIKIETGNDAFRDAKAAEIARILTDLADHIEGGVWPSKLYDYNGNAVGTCKDSERG